MEIMILKIMKVETVNKFDKENSNAEIKQEKDKLRHSRKIRTKIV